ncbi:MAG TPA: LysR family transcriptional regulator [Steroidobacteraceae bacterium]
MDTLLSMQVFREVVERGTFVAAADRLNLSTAMASKHVMNMERRLGTRLLNRTSRSLSLTEPGSIFFERCKVLLDDLEQAESAVGSFGGAPRGTLRITAPSWMASRRMAEFLAAHRIRYPEVVVDMAFEDRFVDIVEEGYDLALRSTVDSPPQGLIARPLRAVPLVIAASTTYLERYGTPQLPEELARHDCVMVGSGHAWYFMGPSGVIEVPAKVVLRFRSTNGVAHAVSTGIGVAPLPLTVIEDPQFRGTLRPILVNYPLRHPTLFAVYLSRKLVSPKIRTLIDHLVEHIAQIPLPQPLELNGQTARPSSARAASSKRAREGRRQVPLDPFAKENLHHVAAV